MIIREWSGRARRSKGEAYPKHFRDNVASRLRKVSGFLGAHLCHRKLDDEIEFLLITRWQSMEAIRAFAGADAEKAIVEPGAVAALVTYDAVVRHYEAIQEVLAPE